MENIYRLGDWISTTLHPTKAMGGQDVPLEETQAQLGRHVQEVGRSLLHAVRMAPSTRPGQRCLATTS